MNILDDGAIGPMPAGMRITGGERILDGQPGADRPDPAREAERRELAAATERIRVLEDEAKAREEHAARRVLAAKTAGIIDGQLQALAEDRTHVGLKTRETLLTLKMDHASGVRAEGQDEKWFLDRVGAIMSDHLTRQVEARDELSDVPRMGPMPGRTGPQGEHRFDVLAYLEKARSYVGQGGSRFEFEGPHVSAEHEALKDVYQRHPTLQRLHAQARRDHDPTRGPLVPVPVRSLLGESIRHQLAETYSEAANWRTADYQRQLLVDFFRAALILDLLGVSMMTVDNDIVLPRITAAVTATMEAETATVADSGLTISTGTSSPKRMASRDDISWMSLVSQGGFGIEGLVQSEIGRALLDREEQQGFTGSGTTNNCRGVQNVTGVHAITEAGSKPTFREILSMPREVADENIPTAMFRYAFNSITLEDLMTILRFTGTTTGAASIHNTPAYRPMDSSPGNVGTAFRQGGMLVGYPAYMSNHLPRNLGASNNESLMLGGVWMYLLNIRYSMAFLTIDDVSLAASAQTRITANVFIDFFTRLPQAFSLLQWNAA